jgi:beta-glucosidase
MHTRELTLEQKVAMCAGEDLWHTTGVRDAGVPRIKVTDGPSGARGARLYGTTSASFPCGTAFAATWNTGLMREVGAALADEARTKGAHVLLGPTVNIHRTPLAGRNFECYSEDPFLTARIAVAFIVGLQSKGVAACVKHFACNDQEHERMSISAAVDARTLREIYLPPFEAAVREAHAWCVMAAYNRFNETYCAENAELIAILKEEWGFDGVLMSDWWGTKSTAASANAGLDLEMPGPPSYFGEALRTAVRNGEVGEDTIDDKVRRLSLLAERTGASLDQPAEQSVDDPARRALARRTAGESIVLLRNEDAILPLDPSATIAVIGPNAAVAQVQGGGSAQVNPHYEVSPLDGIRARAPHAVHEQGCVIAKAIPAVRIPLTLELTDAGGASLTEMAARGYFRWIGRPHPSFERGAFDITITGTLKADAGGQWTFGLTSAGLSKLYVDDALVIDNWTSQTPGTAFFGLGSSEVTASLPLRAGQRCALRVEFRSTGPISGLVIGCLPPVPDDLLERAVAAAAQADAAVVVVGTTPEWESEGFDHESFSLPGAQDELVERIAAVQPRTVVVVNTGSPYAMPWASRVPAIVQTWFGGQEYGNAVADVLFGDVNPSGKLPATFPVRIEDVTVNYPGVDGVVAYEEGIFVGYRSYDARGVEPRFCFGHGLSYTTFAYGDARVDGLCVEIEVTNIGSRAGAEVVQLYVRDLECSVPRPPKELKGFAKVVLEPGETRTVRFTLDERALSFYDDGWTSEPGEFEVLIGSSSRDIRARAGFGVRPAKQ